LGGVAERFSDPLDRIVQRLVKVDKGIGRPQTLSQLVAGDQFTWALKQMYQYLDGLSLQAKLGPLFSQFAGLAVEFEYAEAQW